MDVKYPIGKFPFDGKITKSVMEEWIDHLDIFYRSGGGLTFK